MAMALGGTITDLQSRMTLNEIKVWMAYRSKYGPMNDVRRHDRPAAILASILSHAHGGNAKNKDFMPWGREEKKEVTLDDLVNAFGGVRVVKKRG